METGNDIFKEPNTQKFLSFIDNSFDVYEFEKASSDTEDHSLFLWYLNRKLRTNLDSEFYFFGVKTTDVYAYKSDISGGFALYFMFRFNYEVVKQIVKEYGLPINATEEEIDNLNIWPLVWKKNKDIFINLEIDYSKNYFLSEKEHCILTISNIHPSERIILSQQ